MPYVQVYCHECNCSLLVETQLHMYNMLSMLNPKVYYCEPCSFFKLREQKNMENKKESVMAPPIEGLERPKLYKYIMGASDWKGQDHTYSWEHITEVFAYIQKLEQMIQSDRWCFASDDDGHNYLIPAQLNQEFESWVTFNSSMNNGCAVLDTMWMGTDFQQYCLSGGINQITFTNPKEF